MAKEVSADYPNLTIDKAISAIEQFNNKLGGKTDSKHVFAQLLGYKDANNGAFLHRLGYLRKYGLISGRGKIELTEMAKNIIYFNTPEERNQAIESAIRNVGLFDKLIEKLGGKEPDEEDFHIFLQDAGMTKKDSINNKRKLQKIYNSFLPYISKDYTPKISDKKMPYKEGEISSTQTPFRNRAVDEDTHFKLDSEGVFVVMPKEQDKMDLLKYFITRWEKQLKEKPKEKN